MPIHCPLSYSGLCPGCTNLYNKKCYAHPLRPVPVIDILTNEERITILEDRLDKLPPPPEFMDILDRLIKLKRGKGIWSGLSSKGDEDLKSQMLYLRNKITEHLAKSAELRKKNDKYLYK